MEEKQSRQPIGNKKGTCKKGFFVLRQCKKPAIAKCAISNRYICEDCLMEWEGKDVCAEEYVKMMRKEGNKVSPDEQLNRWQSGQTTDYTLWYYSMRDDFYINEGYEPFDEFDASGFESSGTSGMGDAEFGGGEFGGAGADASWADDDMSKGGFYDS